MDAAEVAGHVRRTFRRAFGERAARRFVSSGGAVERSPFPVLPDPAAAPAAVQRAARTGGEAIFAGRWRAFHGLDLALDDPPRWQADPLTRVDLATDRAGHRLDPETPTGWRRRAPDLGAQPLRPVAANRRRPPWSSAARDSRNRFLALARRLVARESAVPRLELDQRARVGHPADPVRLDRRVARRRARRRRSLRATRARGRGSGAGARLVHLAINAASALRRTITCSESWPASSSPRPAGPAAAASGASLDTLQRAWEREVLAQFAEDGGNREQALHYHLFACELSWQAAAALAAAGRAIAPPTRQRLERAAVFYATAQVASDPWDYGDSDDAFVTRFHAGGDDPRREWRSWLGGEPGGEAIAFWLGPSPSSGAARQAAIGGDWVRFPDTGIAVRRAGGWTARLDASPLGYLSTAAHGHLDALHLSLWLDDVAIVVDPGTGTYYADPRLRELLASRRSHNGPCPIGLDRPRRLGAFLWSEHHPKPSLATGAAGSIEASLATPLGAVKRSVRFGDADRSWLVVGPRRARDRLLGPLAARAGLGGGADGRARLARRARRRPNRDRGRRALGRDRDRDRSGVAVLPRRRRTRPSSRCARERRPTPASFELSSGGGREDRDLRPRLRRLRDRGLPRAAGPHRDRRRRAGRQGRRLRARRSADRRARPRRAHARRARRRTTARHHQRGGSGGAPPTPRWSASARRRRSPERSTRASCGRWRSRSRPRWSARRSVTRWCCARPSCPARRARWRAKCWPRRSTRERSISSTTPSSCARGAASPISTSRRSPRSAPPTANSHRRLCVTSSSARTRRR